MCECFIGFVFVIVMGVSFLGELVYEIYIFNVLFYVVFFVLCVVGEVYGMMFFGVCVVEFMCMEKGFFYWKSDLIIEFDFFEIGLDCFVKMDKFGFVGKEVLMVC